MSWRTARSLNVLRAQVDAAAPGRSKRSDGTIGDAAHRARTSDHNAWVPPPAGGVVTAWDVTHDPARGCDVAALTEALRRARDPRIKYVIHDRRMFSSYATRSVEAWTWRHYRGSNGHLTHAHVSVQPTGYDRADVWTLPDSWRRAPAITDKDKAMIEQLVRGIQESLTAAGNDPGPVDGDWGPRTQTALTANFKDPAMTAEQDRMLLHIHDHVTNSQRPGGLRNRVTDSQARIQALEVELAAISENVGVDQAQLAADVSVRLGAKLEKVAAELGKASSELVAEDVVEAYVRTLVSTLD